MFDPYHKWLGIPPKDQPPNHYRLLGIDAFEADLDVIDAAANKQMAYIQGCATGPHVALSQKLLNEIAAARLCLLSPARKTAYDADLKVKLARPPGPTMPGLMPMPASGPMPMPVGYFPPPGVMPPGYLAPQPPPNEPNDLALLPSSRPEDKKPVRRRTPDRGKNSAAPLVLIALGLVILVVAIVALAALGVFDSQPEKTKQTVPDRPAAPVKEKPKKSDPKAHP